MDLFFSQISLLSATNIMGVPIGTLACYVFFTALTIAAAFGLKKVMGQKEQKNSLSRNAAAQEKTEENKRRLEERKPALLWNTVMFFPDYHASEPDSTTQQFLWYFAQARMSILACIYNLSFPELISVLIQQHERGLIVQFVVENEMTADVLRKKCLSCGILPKDPNIPSTCKLMHHKFAVIDDEAVLTGSMNWNDSGVFNNKENVCVSTNPTYVKIYLQEFLKLHRICEKANTI